MIKEDQGIIEYSPDNIFPKYVLENKIQKYFNSNTPNHYIFLCILVDDFYVKSYKTRIEADNNPINLYYKNKEIILYYDENDMKFVLPISREYASKFETINKLKKELDSLISSYNYLENMKEYKWE